MPSISNIFPPLLRRLLRSSRGGVAVMAGMSLPVVLGGLGLAVDLGRGLEQRMINQRVADVAALGAAMAYQQESNMNLLTPVARDLVSGNGLTDAQVTAAIVDDFPSSGDQSVRVTVSVELPYTLARVVGAPASYSVRSEAFASLSSSPEHAAPCFLALSSGSNALYTQGGASIVAPNCAVAAVGQVNNGGSAIHAADIISGGGNITNGSGTLNANSLRYAGSFDNPAWNNNVPPADKRFNKSTTLIDPWAASSELTSARAQLGDFTPLPALSNPPTPAGSNWDFNWSPAANVAPFRVGTSGVYNVPAGNYTIGKLSVGGGITVNFASGSNITIANGFSNGGSSFNFGNSNVFVNGGFSSGSSGVTFGNGSLWIGSGSVSFAGTNVKGSGDVIINAPVNIGGGSSFVMGAGDHKFLSLDISGGGYMVLGDGNFQVNQGITVGGNSELSIGNGNVLIGPRGNGNAINLAGSARFFMGDGQFSANGQFSVNGHIITAGGSRIRFPATTNHYINGNMTIAGSALFGAGRYTISGNFTNGTGGTVWPYTSSYTGITHGQTLNGVAVNGYDMAGVDVTFVLGGTLNLAGGAKTLLQAPNSSVPGGQIRDMLLHSMTSANTNWTAGVHNIFAGTVYLPNSLVTMGGGNSTLSADLCFTLIASRIAATGGAVAGSACNTMEEAYGGGGSGVIRLVR